MLLSQLNAEQTHILINGEWFEIMEDQEGSFYYIVNGKAKYVTFEPERKLSTLDKILLVACFVIVVIYSIAMAYSIISTL